MSSAAVGMAMPRRLVSEDVVMRAGILALLAFLLIFLPCRWRRCC